MRIVMPFAARARMQDYFSPADIARADSYRGPAYALGFGALALVLLALAMLAFGPRGWMSAIARGRRWWAQSLAFVAVVTFVPLLVSLPLDVARHLHERRFGLATNSVAGFLLDTAKNSGFQLAISAVAAVVFVGVARAVPRGWPIIVATAGAVLTVALVFVLPVVYEPAFNRFTPVDAATRDRVLAIAGKAGVSVRDVLVADASRRTTKENAYVSGIGSTKRVVLYDTLLQKLPPSEVDLVVAHELSHEKHHDVLKGTAYGVAGVVVGVIALWLLLGSGRARGVIGVSGPGDPRAIPFLAFFIAVASVATLPLQNWVSRAAEASADRSAIRITGDPNSAIALEVRLARNNIADLHPNGFIRWAFFTHPTTLERIQFALDEQAAHR